MMHSRLSLRINAEKVLEMCFVLYPMIIWSVLSGNANITSVLFYALCACEIILLLLSAKKLPNSKLGLLILIVALAFLSVLASSITHGISITFRGLINYLSFVICMSYILFSGYYEGVSKKTVRRINAIGLFTAALYPIGYFAFDFNVRSNLFSMNFSNPNLTGMFLVQAVYYLSLIHI